MMHESRKSERTLERLRPVRRGLSSLAIALVFMLVSQTYALAQQGRVVGRVVDAELAEPLGGAQVELITGTGGVVGSATTNDDGSYTITGVPAGTYSIIVSTLGYRVQRVDGISVGAGSTTVEPIRLVSRVFELNPVVVTASREREKALDAPAAVYTVDEEEIREQQQPVPADYVRSEPGMDAWSYGIQQRNMTARGFNNIFSSSLYVLTDNRWASVPSLRLNAYNLIPTTNDDIERIEVILGPASALYGPNVDKGVMHMITSSPLDKQETVFSAVGGARGDNDLGDARSLWQGSLRHSGIINENVGYKISGSYLHGNDWVSFDPVEQAARQQAIAGGADPNELKIGDRDFTAQRLTADARLDVRVGEDGQFVFSGGTAGLLSSIELTGIGAAQADNWFYSYVQTRFRKGRLFAQAYTNFSDSGDSFTLRDGRLVSDNSSLWVGQIQHGASLGERQNFTYGADVIRTIPDTEGTIHGDNEDADNIWEIGAYLQSETQLTDQLELVLAGRVDHHDVVDVVVFSPRAALVYQPVEGHSFRATYNRAFSQPTSVNLFLDLPSSPRGDITQDPGATPFGVHAGGVPADGYSFMRDGNGDPFMYTFWAPLLPGISESDPLPLDATQLWDLAAQLLLANSGGQIDVTGIPAPDATQVGTQLRALNTTNLTFVDVPNSFVQDVPGLDPTITNTVEAGYKGLIGDRLLLGLDVYYSRIEDFISPLRVETPTVFLEPGSLATYLANFMPAAQAQQIAAVMGGVSGSTDETTRGIPLAMVTPTNTQAENQGDVLITYRQFGEVDLWGVDLGVELLLSENWSVNGSYSHASDDFFQEGVSNIALNAPKNKAALGLQFRHPRLGFSAGLRGRYIEGFPFDSGVYTGTVDDYELVDLNLAYALPFYRDAMVTLTGTNIFNNKHRQVIGSPEISSIWLLRLRYTLP